jgi:hypothetical protein
MAIATVHTTASPFRSREARPTVRKRSIAARTWLRLPTHVGQSTDKDGVVPTS